MRRSPSSHICLAIALLVPASLPLAAAQKKSTTKSDAPAASTQKPPPDIPQETEGRSLSDIASSAASSIVNFPKKLLSPLIPFSGKKKEPVVVTIAGIPKSIDAGKTTRLNLTVEVLNQGKKPVSLDFESNIRVLASIEQASGEKVSSTEYVADTNPDPTSLTVNPTEKLRYDLSLSLEKPLRGALYNIKTRIASENIQLEAKSSVLVR